MDEITLVIAGNALGKINEKRERWWSHPGLRTIKEFNLPAPIEGRRVPLEQIAQGLVQFRGLDPGLVRAANALHGLHHPADTMSA